MNRTHSLSQEIFTKWNKNKILQTNAKIYHRNEITKSERLWEDVKPNGKKGKENEKKIEIERNNKLTKINV